MVFLKRENNESATCQSKGGKRRWQSEQEEPQGSEEGEGEGSLGCQPNLLKIDSCCGFIESYM